MVTDPQSGKAVAVTWESQPRPGTMLTHPGVYCLRTNLSDWDQETLWRTYTMLTDLEAVFRSLKSDCAPSSTKSRTVPTDTCSSPSSPTNCTNHPPTPRRVR